MEYSLLSLLANKDNYYTAAPHIDTRSNNSRIDTAAVSDELLLSVCVQGTIRRETRSTVM